MQRLTRPRLTVDDGPEWQDGLDEQQSGATEWPQYTGASNNVYPVANSQGWAFFVKTDSVRKYAEGSEAHEQAWRADDCPEDDGCPDPEVAGCVGSTKSRPISPPSAVTCRPALCTSAWHSESPSLANGEDLGPDPQMRQGGPPDENLPRTFCNSLDCAAREPDSYYSCYTDSVSASPEVTRGTEMDRSEGTSSASALEPPYGAGSYARNLTADQEQGRQGCRYFP